MKFVSGITFLIIIYSVITPAQSNVQDSIWRPFKSFIGTWEGRGGGDPGQGDYERSYKFIFGGKYIEVRNKSVYPATESNPSGEVHEDLGYVSYDKIRKTFILRQFHVEGFVNQYKLDTISADGKYIVFVSETIENIKPGWRAKEIYNIKNGNEFTETFELAEPEKDFEVYTRAVLNRVLK